MFWEDFVQATCLPNNCGCELIRFGEWIRQPANFFSSLAYVFIGIRLLFISKTFHQRFWSSLCIVLGISSHLAHASFVQVFMSMDFTSIITLMIYPPLTMLTQKKGKGIHLLSVLVSSLIIFGLMFFLPKWIKIISSLGLFAVILVYHIRYMKNELRHGTFLGSLALLTLGFLFFMLDEAKIFCVADNWFQLHSLWHVLTALALFMYGKWSFYSGRW